MAVTAVGTPAAPVQITTANTTVTVTGSWSASQPRTAGDLLVMVVTAAAATSVTVPATPSGWTLAVASQDSATPHTATAVFWKIATGADAAPSSQVTVAGSSSTVSCVLMELAGVLASAPAATTGTYASGSSSQTLTGITVTSAGNVPGAGAYAVAAFATERSASQAITWTPGTGWANLENDGATSGRDHQAIDVYAGPPSGSALSDAATFTSISSAFGTAALVVFAAAPVAPPFPQSPLDTRCELNLGGTWTDVTSYALARAPVTITRGRPDETSAASPSQATWQLSNRDGRFSPRNPTGPYYGLFQRNTWARWSVPGSGNTGPRLRLEDNTLDTASGASCPDTAALELTSGLDVRVDLRLSNWQPCVLASRWTAGDRSWALVLNDDGTLGLWWTPDGINAVQAASTQPLASTARLTVRAVLVTGSPGTVTFWTGPAGGAAGSSWTQLGDTVSATGALYAGTAPVAVAECAGVNADYGTYFAPNGSIYQMVLLNASAVTVASPDFTSQAAGVTTFADAQGNTWTLAGSAAIDDRNYRFAGECVSLPQRWDPTGTDVYTPVTASGPLRQISAGQSPAPSAMRSFIQSRPGGYAPVAYWPCEDGSNGLTTSPAVAVSGITKVASGLPNGDPMDILGNPQFASSSVFLCSAALPTLNGGQFSGPVPGYSSGSVSAVRFLLQLATGLTGTVCVMRLVTNGLYPDLYLMWDSANSELQLIPGTGLVAPLVTLSLAAGTPVLASIELSPLVAGGTVYTVPALEVMTLGGTITSATGTSAAGTPGAVRRVTPGAWLDNSAFASPAASVIGHLFVQAGTVLEPLADFADALAAYTGETAGDRFARLCAESSIPGRVIGAPGVTVAMGPQTADTLANLLAECEGADHGQTFESRETFALCYRTLAALCQQPAVLTLDYASAQLGDGTNGLQPVDDDAYTRNDIIVTRGTTAITGSSHQAVLDDGSPMSISPPPAGVGEYSTSVTRNLADDAQLPDDGGWELLIGTVNEERYPVVPLNLARTAVASLTETIAEADAGDQIEISNPPAWLPPGPIAQLVLGFTETLGNYTWTIAFNCVPASPYGVGLLDDTSYGRADTDGSQLASAVTATATAIDVETTGASGICWTQNAADMPFDIEAAGEVMTVSAVTGLGSRTGVFLSAAAMGEASWASALADWQSWTGETVRVSRAYYGLSTFPTSDATLAAMAAGGIKACLNLTPAYNPVSSADLASLAAMLAYWQAQGLQMEVSLWAEPYNNGLTAAQFIAMIDYYGPTVRQYCPLVFCTSAFTVDNNDENSYYPGDSAVDKIATDLYAIRWLAGTSLDLAASLADNAVPPKPFGLWEFGASPVGENWLTGDSSGFEGSTGTWTGAGNATLSRSGAQANHGTGSLAVTSAAAGNASAGSCAAASIATEGMPCSPGNSISCRAWARAAATARSVTVGATFYSSAGALISTLSGTAVADSPTAWTELTATVAAPANAAYCRLAVTIEATAAGEVHYLDDCALGNLSVGQDETDVTDFYQYVQDYFAGRLTGGRLNSDLIMFNSGAASGGGIVAPVTYDYQGADSTSTAYRIALFQALHGALDSTGSPQALTVTRSVNGVVKAQAAGTAVSLSPEPITALT